MKVVSLFVPALLAVLLQPMRAFAQVPVDASAEATPTEPASAPPSPDASTDQAQKPEPEAAPSRPAIPPSTWESSSAQEPSFPSSAGGIWWGTSGERPRVPFENWYGWQTLIGVSTGDLMMLISLNKEVDEAELFLRFGGGLAHVFTGPIVHWAHGRVGRGFGVLGLNLTLTLAGMVGQYAFDYRSDAKVVPVLIGLMAGPALDISLFSTEITHKAKNMSSMRLLQDLSLGVVPMLDSNRYGLMIAGQF